MGWRSWQVHLEGQRVGYDAKGWYWFQEVPSGQVRATVHAEAERMLGHVRRDLGLSHVRLRWFRLVQGFADTGQWPHGDMGFSKLQGGDSPRSLRGRTHPFLEPDVIWLRATLPATSIGWVVAHEARHLWQFQVAGWAPSDLGDDPGPEVEADARSYELMAGIYYDAAREGC